MVATRYALGVAYLQLGRKVAARGQLEAALRLKPGDPLIESALARAR
jgi:Flp pilus assembly protein TadD